MRRISHRPARKRRKTILWVCFAFATLLLLTVSFQLHVRVQRDLTTSLSIKNDSENRNHASDLRSHHQLLEFVHITKTAGSAVERAASKANIIWGVCHFQQDEGCLPNAPDQANRNFPLKHNIPIPNFSGEPWHTPPSWFVTSPYSQAAATFTIVRNPYERYISEFYCPYYGINGEGKNENMMFRAPVRRRPPRNRPNAPGEHLQARLYSNGSEPWSNQARGYSHRRGLSHEGMNNRNQTSVMTPEMLNRWLTVRLRGQSTITGHMMPQHFFVYDANDGTQVIDHVLRYETLQEDFAKLMEQYQLPIRLPKQAQKSPNETEGRRLTVADLTPETIQLINDFATEDFRMFGYEMIDP